MKVMLGALLGLLLASAASADTVWTYTGNTMDGSVNAQKTGANCNCALTGSVVFADPIVPVFGTLVPALAWDFTDGTHTLTQANSTATFSTPTFPGSPLFSTWTVNIMSSNWFFHTQFYGSATEATDFSIGMTAGSFVPFGYVEGNHGFWTESVGATEPTTALLVGLGLAAMGLMRRRKKTRPDTAEWENLG